MGLIREPLRVPSECIDCIDWERFDEFAAISHFDALQAIQRSVILNTGIELIRR